MARSSDWVESVWRRERVVAPLCFAALGLVTLALAGADWSAGDTFFLAGAYLLSQWGYHGARRRLGVPFRASQLLFWGPWPEPGRSPVPPERTFQSGDRFGAR